MNIPQFETLHLNASLRSTGAISRFATRWKRWSETPEFECHPAHNFEGECVDIQIIQKCGIEVLEYPHFTAKCVTSIKHTAEKLGDHGVLPVIYFMSNALQDMLFSTFKIMFPNQPCISRTEYMNHQPRNHGTTIVSYNPREIEGIEFGSVVIVISYTHLADFNLGEDIVFFTAITRGSTKLTIIVSDLQLFGCREVNEDLANTLQECCLTKEWGTFRLEKLLGVYYPMKKKPFLLLVGFKPSFTSFQKQKYKGRDLSSIEGVSEYAGEQEEKFLHVADVFENSSLEKFRKFGIEVICVTPENQSCRMQNIFYNATSKLIKAFSDKRGHPFRICDVGGNNARACMEELFSLLSFVKSESKTHGTITNIDLLKKNKDSERIVSDISWRKWKPKANALFRTGEWAMSLDAYSFTLESLKKEHLLAKQSGSLYKVIEMKKEAAKILTNLSLLCLKSSLTRVSKHPIQLLVPFWLDMDDLQSLQSQLMKALFFAIHATYWDICWCKSYDRIGTAVQKLKGLYSEQMQDVKKAPTITLNARIKSLIDEDKTLNESVSFWDASDMKHTTLYADFGPTLNEFTDSVKNYKDGLQSSSIEELISLRKEVSDAIEELQNRTDDVIKETLLEEANDLTAIIMLHNEAENLRSGIIFGTYAVRWNPTKIKNYETLLASLERFETMINQLRDKTNRISEDLYLEDIARMEINQPKMETSSANDW